MGKNAWWTVLGWATPLGQLDQSAAKLGFQRIRGGPLRRAAWRLKSGDRLYLLTASVEGEPSFGAKLVVSPVPSAPFGLISGADDAENLRPRPEETAIGSDIARRLETKDTLSWGDGRLAFSTRNRPSLLRLLAIMKLLLGVSEAMTERLPKRLLKVALEDEDESFSESAAACLLSNFGASEEASLLRSSKDRFRASIVCGAACGLPSDQAFSIWVEMAKDASMSEVVRTRALLRLASMKPPPKGREGAFHGLLRQLMVQKSSSPLRRKALDVASEVPGLTPELVSVAHGRDIDAARLAIAHLGRGQEESALIELLLSEAFEKQPLALRQAVIDQLGATGSHHCLPALVQLGEQAGFHAPLARAAVRAALQVRRRNQLQLAGGELGLATDGKLSEPQG